MQQQQWRVACKWSGRRKRLAGSVAVPAAVAGDPDLRIAMRERTTSTPFFFFPTISTAQGSSREDEDLENNPWSLGRVALGAWNREI